MYHRFSFCLAENFFDFLNRKNFGKKEDIIYWMYLLNVDVIGTFWDNDKRIKSHKFKRF